MTVNTQAPWPTMLLNLPSSPDDFIWKPFCWASAGVSLWSKKGETMKIFSPTLTQCFSTPSSPPTPLPCPRGHKITGAFGSEFPPQWEDPHICISSTYTGLLVGPPQVYLSMRENKIAWESRHSLVLASCFNTYYLITRSVKSLIVTSVLACCFKWSLWYLAAQLYWDPDTATPGYPMILFKIPCIKSCPIKNLYSSFFSYAKPRPL